MLVLLGQVAIVISASLLVAWGLGGWYLFVAGIIALVCYALFLARDLDVVDAKQIEPGEVVQPMLLGFFGRLFLAIFLGMFWPSLPIIVWRGNALSRIDGEGRRNQ